MNELQRDLLQRFELPLQYESEGNLVLSDGHGTIVVIQASGLTRTEVNWGGEVRAWTLIECEAGERRLVGVQLGLRAHLQDLAELIHAIEPLVDPAELDTHLARLLIPPQVGSATPWGAAEHVEEVEREVWLVHGRDHGGYWLGLGALARLPAPARLPGSWYEEDVAAMIPAAFLGWADRTPHGQVTRDAVRRNWPDLALHLDRLPSLSAASS